MTTPAGESATTVGDRFNYTAVPPTVTQISPTSGPGTGGNQVIITGTNFAGADQVFFGSFSTNFTIQSATQITATAPIGVGTVDVTVDNQNLRSATIAADQYTYTSPPPAPTVTSVSPNTGPTAGGTTVFIGGSNFVQA